MIHFCICSKTSKLDVGCSDYRAESLVVYPDHYGWPMLVLYMPRHLCLLSGKLSSQPVIQPCQLPQMCLWSLNWLMYQMQSQILGNLPLFYGN